MKHYLIIFLVLFGITSNVNSQEIVFKKDSVNNTLSYSKKLLSSNQNKDSVIANWLVNEFSIPLNAIKFKNNSIVFSNNTPIYTKKIGPKLKDGVFYYKITISFDSLRYNFDASNLIIVNKNDSTTFEKISTTTDNTNTINTNLISSQIVEEISLLSKSFEESINKAQIKDKNIETGFIRFSITYNYNRLVSPYAMNENTGLSNYINDLMNGYGYSANIMFFKPSKLGFGVNFIHSYSHNTQNFVPNNTTMPSGKMEDKITTNIIATSIGYSAFKKQSTFNLIPSAFIGLLFYQNDGFFQQKLLITGNTVTIGTSITTDFKIKINSKKDIGLSLTASFIYATLNKIRVNGAIDNNLSNLKSDLSRVELSLGICLY